MLFSSSSSRDDEVDLIDGGGRRNLLLPPVLLLVIELAPIVGRGVRVVRLGTLRVAVVVLLDGKGRLSRGRAVVVVPAVILDAEEEETEGRAAL